MTSKLPKVWYSDGSFFGDEQEQGEQGYFVTKEQLIDRDRAIARAAFEAGQESLHTDRKGEVYIEMTIEDYLKSDDFKDSVK